MGIPEADAEPEGYPSSYLLSFPYSLIPLFSHLFPYSLIFFLFVPLILLYLFIPLEKKSCLSLSSLCS